MTLLSQAFLSFDPRNLNDETIEAKFAHIADVAMNKGYFLINGKVKIYPVDIEFYLYGERDDDSEWMKDFNMYHKGKNVPYFPAEGSVFPHRTGVDITFENEAEQYRASFLIRKYKTSEHDEIENHPTYLWEEMFGESSFGGNGFNIIWVDEPSCQSRKIESDTRINLNGKDGKKDTKEWRFFKVSNEPIK